MQMIAQYPVSPSFVEPHVGRPVAAMLHNGDMVYGILDRVHEGHLVMRPMNNIPEATVAKIKEAMKKSVPANVKNNSKARIKAYGGYDGGHGRYPYGYGYGNYGWGAGWWWIFPLFFLTALATLPFFFI